MVNYFFSGRRRPHRQRDTLTDRLRESQDQADSVDSGKDPHQPLLVSARSRLTTLWGCRRSSATGCPGPTLGRGCAHVVGRCWTSHRRIWLREEGLWGTSSRRSLLSTSQSRLRASSWTGLTTARSPSGERTDEQIRGVVPWPVALAALSRVGEFRPRKGKKGARVWGSAPAPILFFRDMRVFVRWDSMAHSALGWMKPRWAERMAAQAFTPICEI
jgi:hypothetical protein